MRCSRNSSVHAVAMPSSRFPNERALVRTSSRLLPTGVTISGTSCVVIVGRFRGTKCASRSTMKCFSLLDSSSTSRPNSSGPASLTRVSSEGRGLNAGVIAGPDSRACRRTFARSSMVSAPRPPEDGLGDPAGEPCLAASMSGGLRSSGSMTLFPMLGSRSAEVANLPANGDPSADSAAA